MMLQNLLKPQSMKILKDIQPETREMLKNLLGI